ncbi:hypothetical protein [Streptomyces diastaticus]|uniref:hypothetical protein n=1 Tax=Streptomyces diastaticus TaxID=1956 RepID=UPI003430E419
MLTVNGRSPLPSAYASSAGVLLLCATWLTVVVTGPDDPARRAVLAVSAGGAWKVLLATVATAPACCTALGGQLAVADGSAEWFGFPGVARVPGLACEVLLVPLPGHSAGHTGVAVRDGDGRWLLHAGDAYMYHGEIERTPPLAHPAFAPVQQGAQTDAEAVRATRERLRALRRDHGDRVTVFSAHDPWEFARLTTPPPLPAPAPPGR